MARPRRQLSDEAEVVLEEVWEAQLEHERALQRRDQLAVRAAELGATWREIGAACGISPQAAHERFNPRLRQNRVKARLALAPPTPPGMRVRTGRFAQHSG